MLAVTDVVRIIAPFWSNPPWSLMSYDEDGSLYIVEECNRYGCSIRNLETGNPSAWWNYHKLEKVRDGSFEELDETIKKERVKCYDKL